MKQRCLNPNAANYIYYGGRGISVCDRWRDSFANFVSDMDLTYFDGAQLDRIDNDGDYSPDNCRWATYDQNARNKSSNRTVIIRGKEMIITDAARAHGLDPDVVLDRVNRYGWDIDRALTTPVRTPRVYRFNGSDMTITQISKATGINRETLRLRLKRGLSVADATRSML